MVQRLGHRQGLRAEVVSLRLAVAVSTGTGSDCCGSVDATGGGSVGNKAYVQSGASP